MCDRQSSFNGFMEFLLHLPFHHNHVDLLEIEQSLDQKRKKVKGLVSRYYIMLSTVSRLCRLTAPSSHLPTPVVCARPPHTVSPTLASRPPLCNLCTCPSPSLSRAVSPTLAPSVLPHLPLLSSPLSSLWRLRSPSASLDVEDARRSPRSTEWNFWKQ